MRVHLYLELKKKNDLPGHNFIVNFHNAVWITGSSAKDHTQKTVTA